MIKLRKKEKLDAKEKLKIFGPPMVNAIKDIPLVFGIGDCGF